MHSEIEANQTHEVRYVHFIDCGAMVSFLIGDHKFAPFRRITWTASRTLGPIHRYAIFNEGDSLQSERNFEALSIRRWSAAEKNLCGAPVTRFCRDIQRRHLIPARQSVPV